MQYNPTVVFEICWSCVMLSRLRKPARCHAFNSCRCGHTRSYRYVWLDTRGHAVITQYTLTPACLSALHWWCWKLVQPSPGQPHHSWWWGNLLCRLSIEDSSLERLPASILITSLTEIRKSLFSTLPFSFSLPVGLPLLLFPHLSPYQPTAHLMGVSIFQPVSNSRNGVVSYHRW